MDKNVKQRKQKEPTSNTSKSPSPSPSPQQMWGRHYGSSWLDVFLALVIVLCCPLSTIAFWLSCEYFNCALSRLVEFSASELFSFFPTFDLESFMIYFFWLVFQIFLYIVLPSPIAYGQITPAGNLLPYKVNGFFAYMVTLFLYVFGAYLGFFRMSIIHDHWGGLFIMTNIYGYFLSFFSYFKAHLFPTHPDDCKFTGSIVYDYFMGIELNPRIGKMFDFKLFHNGRPGIIAWSLINISNAAAQYYRFGKVTNSMMLVNYIQAVYVIDFFWNENRYLRTIDIAHDHFGFYLSWGDCVWLPFMYTLQGQYLARNPVELHWIVAVFVFLFANAGYLIFRFANNQKDIVRKTKGECKIWGKKPSFILAKYKSSDGNEHESILLTDGFLEIQ